ncbi:hypothetical protein EYC98_09060 [Halieaceae bacterium IMCC14734]|uniref:Glutathione S-transferase n=1 Tax=Candidatus Litorirhabdus singularis TaxID=2518993 RepID=A0ABT3TFC6_9GAMM|nr:glutathione S-transferase C-terminal domain-containing protein [Candidatus Litorirhabdus singularis]MCX2981012.1 hypothetical protein [Candidatus Litorirhabdus singularis]
MSETIVWGVEASPYLLKLEACLRFRQMPFRRLPRAGSRRQNLLTFMRLQRAIRNRQVMRFPAMDSQLDEYPSVPFFSPDGSQFQYDSSAIADWLDLNATRTPALTPAEPDLRFVVRLLDEAFDEFGLYMVHHMRWKGSANSTPMGAVTGAEMSRLLPLGLHRLVARNLPRRQVRRCPYLFSVAPADYQAGVIPALTPPTRQGFPPTHSLLEQCWRECLTAMESLLEQQPWLLGGRFTLADASLYGQLSMNLIDPQANALLRELAPRTHAWLCAIRDGSHVGSAGTISLQPALAPLLKFVMSTFAPLMQQNLAAWQHYSSRGETLFNEAAFDQGRALYDGTLRQHPFRAAAKTFQVRVWQDLRQEWLALPTPIEQLLQDWLPNNDLFSAAPAATTITPVS